MKIGNDLKKMRENAGISQQHVSIVMKWKTPQLVSNFERGISLPPASSIYKLAKLYNVDYEMLKILVLQASVERYRDKLLKRMKRVPED